LQEKYDENGYDCSPLIKLQRIESHVDLTIEMYKDMANKPEQGIRWVKAIERLPKRGEKVFWRRDNGEKIYTGFDSFDDVKYMGLPEIVWLSESTPSPEQGEEKEGETKWDRLNKEFDTKSDEYFRLKEGEQEVK
jgi:hypothetical protein